MDALSGRGTVVALILICCARTAAQAQDLPPVAVPVPIEATQQTAEPAQDSGLAARSGLQWLLASGKAMPGIFGSAGGRWVLVGMEAGLIWTTQPVPNDPTRFLGSQLALFVLGMPYASPWFDLALGSGVDAYPLWGINLDTWEVALSLRAHANLWITRKFGLFVHARAYPLQTAGLELGTARDEREGSPVLFGIGVTVRTR